MKEPVVLLFSLLALQVLGEYNVKKHKGTVIALLSQFPNQILNIQIERLIPIIFLIPALTFIFVVLIIPLLANLILGFYNWNLLSPDLPNFVGLENYISMFKSVEFWDSIVRTLIFAFSTIFFQFLLGFAFALALTSVVFKRWSTLIRGIVILPLTLTTVVAATMWRLMYEPQFGIINYALDSLGISHNLIWLSSPSTALLSVIIVEIWRNTPFVALILAAGLAMLPEEPYEASFVDGASPLQSFFYITLPLMQNAIMLALVLRLMDALKAFGIVHVLTKGGPARLTEIVSIRVFKEAFEYFDIGYGAVLAQVVLIITILFSVLVIKVIKLVGSRNYD